MLHDIPAPDSILSPLTYANSMTNQWFGGFIVLFIFMVTFVGLKMYKSESALLVAAVTSFVCTVLLIPLGVASPILLGIPIVLILAGLFMSFYN